MPVALIFLALTLSGARAEGAPSIDEPLRMPATAPGDAAVVFGVENYLAVPAVPYARRDAQSFADFLTYTRGVPQDNVELITSTVTVETIRRGVANAVARTGEGGRTWVYFAGHGSTHPETGERTWLADDVRPEPRSFVDRSVPISEVRSWLEASGYPSMILSDACFTGAGRDGSSLSGGKRFVVPAAALPEPSLAVVEWYAASEAEAAGPLEAARHGAFTFFAIGALRGWADGERDGLRDGRVTFDEARAYVQRSLQRVSVGGQRPQMLIDRTQTGETISAGTESSPDLDALMRVSPAPAPVLASTAALPAPPVAPEVAAAPPPAPPVAAASVTPAPPETATSPEAAPPMKRTGEGRWVAEGVEFMLFGDPSVRSEMIAYGAGRCLTTLVPLGDPDPEGWVSWEERLMAGLECQVWTSAATRLVGNTVELRWESKRFGTPASTGTFRLTLASAADVTPPRAVWNGTLLKLESAGGLSALYPDRVPVRLDSVDTMSARIGSDCAYRLRRTDGADNIEKYQLSPVGICDPFSAEVLRLTTDAAVVLWNDLGGQRSHVGIVMATAP